MPSGIYKRKPFTEKHKKKISETRKRLFLENGFLNSLETRKKISETHKKIDNPGRYKKKHPFYPGTKLFEKGHIPWCVGTKGLLKHTEKWKIQQSIRAKEKKWSDRFPHKIGSESSNWRGGITPLYNLIRNSDTNKEWIKSVFKRDNYICQECFNRGDKLEAHHKNKRFNQILQEFLQQYNQFSPIEDKETLLRLAITYKPFWDLNNGETLCGECHNKTKFISFSKQGV